MLLKTVIYKLYFNTFQRLSLYLKKEKHSNHKLQNWFHKEQIIYFPSVFVYQEPILYKISQKTYHR